MLGSRASPSAFRYNLPARREVAGLSEWSLTWQNPVKTRGSDRQQRPTQA